MLWLGIGLALAGEPATEESTYNRLFQEGSLPAGESSSAEQPEIPVGSWIVPALMVILAGGFLAWQRYKPGGLPPTTLRVLQRQPIGDRTSVVLIEIPDRDGESRRLLIGTGPGAPVLLADLGFSENPNEPVRAEKERPAPADRPAVARPTRAEPVHPAATRPEPARSESHRPEPPRATLRSSGNTNIAQEILAERVKVRPQDSFREEGDYDEPDEPSPPDDDDVPPTPPSPPNRGFSRLLARIGD